LRFRQRPASLIMASARRSLPWIIDSSINLAMRWSCHQRGEGETDHHGLDQHIRRQNIDQGDSSRSATAVDFSNLPPSAGAAAASDALAQARTEQPPMMLEPAPAVLLAPDRRGLRQRGVAAPRELLAVAPTMMSWATASPARNHSKCRSMRDMFILQPSSG